MQSSFKFCPNCGTKKDAPKLIKKYPIENNMGVAVRTDEFREPKKGELYLSGAIPTAYYAPNDLSTKFRIMKKITD